MNADLVLICPGQTKCRLQIMEEQMSEWMDGRERAAGHLNASVNQSMSRKTDGVVNQRVGKHVHNIGVDAACKII